MFGHNCLVLCKDMPNDLLRSSYFWVAYFRSRLTAVVYLGFLQLQLQLLWNTCSTRCDYFYLPYCNGDGKRSRLEVSTSLM